MKNAWILISSIVIVVLLSACGLPPLPSEFGSRPHVVSVTPGPDSALTEWPVVDLEFSESILMESVTPRSLFVMNKADYEAYDESDWVTLYNDVKDGDVETIAAPVTFSDDGNHVYIVPGDLETEPGEFTVIALPLITSLSYEPLDQTVAGEVVRQFQTSFLLAPDAEGSLPDQAGTEEPGVGAESSESGVAEPEGDGTLASDGEDAASSPEDDESVAETDGSGEAESAAIPEPEPFDFSRLLVTEIVTDPQQDHGESSPGNGVAFDGIPGAGTVGSTDEYIEIYNGTGDAIDLTGWNVTMTDGTDVVESLGDAGWSKYFSAGGSVGSFLSGEVLVLGNPTGDMKNTIEVELTDQSGQVVHSVYTDDSNANSLDDESFRLNELGTWEMGAATPGEFEY